MPQRPDPSPRRRRGRWLCPVVVAVLAAIAVLAGPDFSAASTRTSADGAAVCISPSSSGVHADGVGGGGCH